MQLLSEMKCDNCAVLLLCRNLATACSSVLSLNSSKGACFSLVKFGNSAAMLLIEIVACLAAVYSSLLTLWAAAAFCEVWQQCRTEVRQHWRPSACNKFAQHCQPFEMCLEDKVLSQISQSLSSLLRTLNIFS